MKHDIVHIFDDMSKKTTGAYAEELKLHEQMQTEQLKSAEQ